MRQTILTNWSIIRFLRLMIGLAIIVQAFIISDVLLGVAGLLFSSMAVFNAGCCGTAVCAPKIRKSSGTIKDTTYEEVV
ncbi:hypothetical protein [Daejeonella oryzae]|uniref:hypothetical protein n=1 Tax=Daejeonella oryzae TaxID=1122943 RepID=UPI00047A30C9|nr:hypothetical protein [Daejeonella oryzae]